jgi:serine/threonine protein kinase
VTPERWARIKDIFGSVLESEEGARAAFLDKACDGDTALREEVESLLAASEGTALNTPVPQMLALEAVCELPEGSLLGRYRVESRLGGGGMGAVYRAFDTQLERLVAVKVLPPEYSSDAAWRSRFLREARAASAISHPNVIAIHEVGEQQGVVFIAMEYVEGQSLDKIVPSQGLPVAQALDYAIGIAAGLAEAHSRGVIHRDLKPANVMVTGGGAVKLLDFGLAKRVRLGEGAEATLTVQGQILGTPSYMSPEQAEGREVDARSDIFSFGSVLYEMLAGQRAFSGSSAVATLGAVLREEPLPLTDIAPELQNLVSCCMRKDPARRIQHIDDVKIALEDIQEAKAMAVPAIVRRPWWRRALGPALLGVAGITAGFWLAMALLSERSDSDSERLMPFATEANAESSASWSPDGKSLAYLVEIGGVHQVFTRALGSPAAVQITRSPAACGPPIWAPDGTRLFYTAGGDLWSSGLAGGEPRLEMKQVVEAALSPDGGTLAFVRGGMGTQSIWISTPAGSEPRQYKREPFPETFVAGYQPTFLPDGASIGVIVDRGSGGGSGEFWILPLAKGTPRRVPAVLAASAWIRYTWWPGAGSVLIGSSDPSSHHLRLMDLDTGSFHRFTQGTGRESEPAISPDGTTVAFTVGRLDCDLVEIPLDRSAVHPLLATASSEESGAWLSPGGQYAYITDVSGIQEVWLRRDREYWARPLLARDAESVPPWYLLTGLRASPDGRHVAYDVLSASHWIWISSVGGGRPVPLETESTDQHSPSWSPDGNRIAYRRLREGKFELAVIPVGGGKPVSLGETGSGGHQRGGTTDWSPAGDWICHLSPRGLELVSPEGSRRRLLTRSTPLMFAFSSDGRTLFILGRAPDGRWQLAPLDVATGAEGRPRILEVPIDATLSELTRHPDGKRFLATLGTRRQDIWLMTGFSQPGGAWANLRRRLFRLP